MQDFVVHENIQRFERMIAAEKDTEKAKILRILLAQERMKLASRRRSELPGSD